MKVLDGPNPVDRDVHFECGSNLLDRGREEARISWIIFDLKYAKVGYRHVIVLVERRRV